jgi:hypothetical protein
MNIPEKWCIKNCQEVGEWFNKYKDTLTYTSTAHENNYLHSHNKQGEEVWNNRCALSYSEFKPKTGFTEITIEQFREYISKTTTTPVQQDYKYLTKLLKTLKIK